MGGISLEGIDHCVNVIGQGVEDWASASGGVVLFNLLEAILCGPAGCDKSNEFIVN
jgi:hypothetical protein